MGELNAAIRAAQTKARRQAQAYALIAYRHALMVGTVVSGGKVPEVWEQFPFWEEEEVAHLRTERIKSMLTAVGARAQEVSEHA